MNGLRRIIHTLRMRVTPACAERLLPKGSPPVLREVCSSDSHKEAFSRGASLSGYARFEVLCPINGSAHINVRIKHNSKREVCQSQAKIDSRTKSRGCSARCVCASASGLPATRNDRRDAVIRSRHYLFFRFQRVINILDQHIRIAVGQLLLIRDRIDRLFRQEAFAL